VIVLGLVSFFDLRWEERQAVAYDRSKAILVSDIIRNGLVTIMMEGRGEELIRYIETMVAEDIKAVRLYSPEGRIIASSIPNERGAVEMKMRSVGRTPRMDISTEGGDSVYRIQTPFFNEQACRKCHADDEDMMCALEVSVTREKAFMIIRTLREVSLINFLFTIVIISVSLGVLTTYFVKRPLGHITATIERVGDGDLSIRADARKNDEIGRLASSLNAMLEKLGHTRKELDTHHMETLQKVEKMANIGELASAIAHEIKNPIAGISGAIQVFAEDFPEGDHRREIVTEVLAEIKRLDKTIKDLLSFAKPPEPSLVRTPTATLIERTTRLISAQVKKQDVNVDIICTGEHREINIDPEQMQQVILNIMMNALHSMPEGGTITVATREIMERNEFEISISDTGIGVAYGELDNIFKPFYTTKHSGTGLGLAISKNIVEKHGGGIVVESKVGLGTTFRVSLPIEVKDA
jgi:signal transduction histidine kinase